MTEYCALAIVIPAYKADFFDAALQSIAAQTCKNFTLYIGDDYSPYELYSTVKNYENKINIVYKRFEENFGGKDLVAQWERCIDMTTGEEWIWLFSDDDVMDKNCVEEFYNALKKVQFDIYRFNINIIDEHSQQINTKSIPPPQVLSSYEFYKKRFSNKLNSFVVEFVFRKSKFYNTQRFQNFDLAWGSDVATWIKIADNKGIYTISNAYINWRSSSINISPNITQSIVARKLLADINFFAWSYYYFKNKNNNVLFLCHKSMFSRLKNFTPYLSKKQTEDIINQYCKAFSFSKLLSIFIHLGLNIFTKKSQIN